MNTRCSIVAYYGRKEIDFNRIKSLKRVFYCIELEFLTQFCTNEKLHYNTNVFMVEFFKFFFSMNEQCRASFHCQCQLMPQFVTFVGLSCQIFTYLITQRSDFKPSRNHFFPFFFVFFCLWTFMNCGIV